MGNEIAYQRSVRDDTTFRVTGGEKELPDVTAADNGKVLTVVEGEWGKGEPLADLVIHARVVESYDETEDTTIYTVTADVTPEEAYEFSGTMMMVVEEGYVEDEVFHPYAVVLADKLYYSMEFKGKIEGLCTFIIVAGDYDTWVFSPQVEKSGMALRYAFSCEISGWGSAQEPSSGTCTILDLTTDEAVTVEKFLNDVSEDGAVFVAITGIIENYSAFTVLSLRPYSRYAKIAFEYEEESDVLKYVVGAIDINKNDPSITLKSCTLGSVSGYCNITTFYDGD